MHSLGVVLFSAAFFGIIVLVTLGVAVTLVMSFHRGRLAAVARRQHLLLDQGAYHRPDPIRTSLIEGVFMVLATALLLVGLPVVLAATFHFLLPLLGHASSSP